MHPRKDHRGVDLISDALPVGRLWYGGPEAVSNAIGYTERRSRSHDAVIHTHPDFIPAVAQETFDHYRDILRDETLEMRFPKLREALMRHDVKQVL